MSALLASFVCLKDRDPDLTVGANWIPALRASLTPSLRRIGVFTASGIIQNN